MSKRIIVLGAAGSIGSQTLDVIRQSIHSEQQLQLVGYSIHTNQQIFNELKREFPLAKSAWTDNLVRAPEAADWSGSDAAAHLLSQVPADIVVNAIAGAAGLSASIFALRNGKSLALANKESIVMAYSLLKAFADRQGLKILPIDSEHAGLFQLIEHFGRAIISELTITASGGPFRNLPLDKLPLVNAHDASQHPTWKMGRKISIDSATMANKGLEIIEATRLFDFPQSQIRVLIHPQSYIHAMVRTIDGAHYAQISNPDMRLPIHNALYWPESILSPFATNEIAGKAFEFFEPEKDRYPLLWIARKAIDQGEASCIAFNAANEIAVAHFEQGTLRFTQISELVLRTLEQDWNLPIRAFEDIFEIDMKARTLATEFAERFE